MKKFAWILFAFAVAAISGCQTLPSSKAPEVRLMQIEGVSLLFIEQGRGVPVVFVHGSMSDHRVWESQREAVASNYRFIAYTQRYFGSEPWRDTGALFSQPTHAADLIAFIEALQVGPVHVVAWSYGGSVATLAATQRPALFRSLSIHEPTIGSLIVGSPDGKSAAAAFAKSIGEIRAVANRGEAVAATKLFWEFVVKLPSGGFEQEASSLQKIVLDNSRSVPLSLNAPPQMISCDMAKKIAAPVLITVGDSTRPLWTLASSALRECVPNGQLVGIANSNHDAIFRQPAAFNQALLRFLKETDAAIR